MTDYTTARVLRVVGGFSPPLPADLLLRVPTGSRAQHATRARHCRWSANPASSAALGTQRWAVRANPTVRNGKAQAQRRSPQVKSAKAAHIPAAPPQSQSQSQSRPRRVWYERVDDSCVSAVPCGPEPLLAGAQDCARIRSSCVPCCSRGRVGASGYGWTRACAFERVFACACICACGMRPWYMLLRAWVCVLCRGRKRGRKGAGTYNPHF